MRSKNNYSNIKWILFILILHQLCLSILSTWYELFLTVKMNKKVHKIIAKDSMSVRNFFHVAGIWNIYHINEYPNKNTKYKIVKITFYFWKVDSIHNHYTNIILWFTYGQQRPIISHNKQRTSKRESSSNKLCSHCSVMNTCYVLH